MVQCNSTALPCRHCVNFEIKNPKMPKGEGKNPKLSLMHQALKLHVPDAFWLSTRFDYCCYYY